jgi:hypothetical protein
MVDQRNIPERKSRMAATENQDFVLEAATNLLTKTVHE